MTATQQVRIVEPIALDNFVLDGEAVRNSDRGYRVDFQRGWETYFAGSGKRLPSLAEYIITFKQLNERKDPALKDIMQDLQESVLCTGTKVDYGTSNLPVGNDYLDVLVKDPAWKKGLQDLLQYDVTEAVKLLQKVSGKRPYIWTPSAKGRISIPEKAVWLYIITDGFYLSCDSLPIGSNGRARGVRQVGAAGARDKNSGSAYRNPAMTKDERLEQQILDALSPFDQLKSPATTELYDNLKQQALQDLKKLYHG